MSTKTSLAAIILFLGAHLGASGQIQWSAEAAVHTASVGSFTIASEDLDGDGDQDLVVGSGGGGSAASVSFLESNGDGTFQAAVGLTSRLDVRDIEVVDLDLDGNLDIVYGSRSNVDVLFGDGAGAFPTSMTLATVNGARFSAVRVADIDGDGNLDVAAFGPIGGVIVVVPGSGGRSFGAAATVHTLTPTGAPSGFGGLVLLPLGGGGPDIVYAAPIDGQFGRLPNTSTPGSISFGTAVVLESGAAGAADVELADIDGDGDLDVVGSANNGTTPLRWFENDGALGSAQPISYPSGIARIDVADFDLDGNVDIVANGSNQVRLVTNAGGGSFGSSALLPLTISNSRGVHAADLDGDARPDVVAVGFSSLDFNRILNLGQHPGTGDDFDLVSQVNGAGVPADDIKTAQAGDVLTMTVASFGGGLDFSASPALVGQVYATGNAPPSPAGFPEIYVNPAVTPAPVLIAGATSGPLGVPLLPPSGISAAFTLPAGLAGLSITLQGFTSSNLAANGLFAATDGHEIDFLP